MTLVAWYNNDMTLVTWYNNDMTLVTWYNNDRTLFTWYNDDISLVVWYNNDMTLVVWYNNDMTLVAWYRFMLGGVDGSFALSTTVHQNRLNQTEPATFTILLFGLSIWVLFFCMEKLKKLYYKYKMYIYRNWLVILLNC